MVPIGILLAQECGKAEPIGSCRIEIWRNGARRPGGRRMLATFALTLALGVAARSAELKLADDRRIRTIPTACGVDHRNRGLFARYRSSTSCMADEANRSKNDGLLRRGDVVVERLRATEQRTPHPGARRADSSLDWIDFRAGRPAFTRPSRCSRTSISMPTCLRPNIAQIESPRTRRRSLSAGAAVLHEEDHRGDRRHRVAC